MSIGKRIKSYLVFTSLGYRLILYLAVPLFIVGIYGWAVSQTVGGSYRSYIAPVTAILIIVEIMADHWFLGGIQEKGAEKLDYLKTSSRGMEAMKSALILDLGRRFLEILAILGLCCLTARFLGRDVPEPVTVLVLPVLEAYGLSVTGTIITRFGSYLQNNLAVSYAAATIGAICWGLAATNVLPAVLLCLIMGFLSVASSVLAVKIAMTRVKEGYYDS